MEHKLKEEYQDFKYLLALLLDEHLLLSGDKHPQMIETQKKTDRMGVKEMGHTWPACIWFCQYTITAIFL